MVVLAPKRQTEIARLAELLAAFRPTVVALEFVPRLDSTMNARYRQYRSGGYTLARGEQEQVGFRVAAALGLSGVNGIDYRKDLDINAVMTFAMAGEFRGFGMEAQNEVQRMMTLVNRFYIRVAQVGRDTNYVGARMASDWYDRNLHIYANISRLVAKQDERVLVLIDAGHAPILRTLIRTAGEWDVVDPVPFLKR
jgi:hypothetical protein